MEAAEVRRKNSRRNNDLTGRASTGAKGAWGSISRVFARNKHRRTLDPSIYTTGKRQEMVLRGPNTKLNFYKIVNFSK